MKLLIGSDLHNSAKGLHWFLKLAEQENPDVVIFLGDFITFEPVSFARQAIRDFSGLAENVLIIPGNCDQRDILLDIDKDNHVTNLHNTSVVISGHKFTGKGGSVTCPSPTPFEDSDEHFADSLVPLIEGTEVLVLHQPIYGFRDRVSGEKHVGSLSLRNLIDIHSPRLVLSGHIHEAKGLDVYKGTHFVNPGPLLELNSAIIETASSIKVSFLKGEM